jgi:multiple sugar transport system substrate-binding protein
MEGEQAATQRKNQNVGASRRSTTACKKGGSVMARFNRRLLLRSSLGVAAAASLGRPFLANAAATTVSVWWPQGFVREEDIGFRAVVEGYEKASGNKIDFTLIPFAPLMQKIVGALTTGDVPDVMSHDTAPATVIPQNAWNDRLVDLSDVVETQKSQYHPTALLACQCYNNITKKRSAYYAPFKTAVLPFHIWNSLVEKAGYKMSDAPKTWDAFWDFFKPMQKKLREKLRGVYAMGLQPTTTGPADGNNMFHYFLAAYGGKGLVTPDGKPHLDDPQVKEAVIRALTYITTAFKEGYVPPGALSWNDADDNNAFHAKQFVMYLDGTISPEVALYHKKEEYNDIVTMGLPLDNAGKQIPAELGVQGPFIPKGAKNIEVAKEFIKYLVQPKVTNEYLKTGLGRWLPAFPDLAKSDPFWLDPKDPHVAAYAREGLLEPTVPTYPVFNPGYAEANSQQIWGTAEADVIREGMTPEAAAEKALKRLGAILAKYPIAQS